MKKRTKTKTKTQPVVIRNYRDTLFRMLYRNKKRLLSLFNAVNGTQYDNPDDLTITTLEGVLYLGMKNDVSCIIDMMMQLYEHQSTVNPNMPLRNLFYVSDLLQKYIYEEGIDIYSRKQIKIPTPKFVVFYNGDEEQPERKEIRLSKAFSANTGETNMELVVLQININKGQNEELKAAWQHALHGRFPQSILLTGPKGIGKLTAARVLMANGIKAVLWEQPVPTPVLSYTVRAMGLGWGIVITASHNPKQYNGYKVYDERGVQVIPEQAELIMKEIETVEFFQAKMLPLEEGEARTARGHP